MEEWKKVKLGEILNFRRGHDLPHSEMQEGIIPVAGSNGIIGFHNVATPIQPIITIGRSGNIGVPYFYDIAWAHNTTLYIDDFKGNNPKYLYYLLKTLPLSSFQGGSAVPTLNRNHIHPIEVYYTDNIVEQDKIVSILSSLDNRIELNRRINDNLEQQAQALFKSWFVDFEPWGGKKPSDWKEGKLGDVIIEVESGSRPKGGAEILGIPSIGAEKIESFGSYNYSGEKYVSKDFYSKMKRGHVKDGDVLLYKDGAYTGKCSMALDGFPYENCAVNEHVFLLRTRDSKYQLYLYLTMTQADIRSMIHTLACAKAAQPGLNTSELLNVETIVPTEDAMAKFNSIVFDMMHAIANNAIENHRFAQLRDSLLPKLMSGELKIS